MTNTQIEEILDIIDYDSEITNNRMGFAPLLYNMSISVVDEGMLPTDIKMYRYKFDNTHDILERARVRIYSYDANNVPSHGKYDIYTVNGQETVYEYLLDKSSKILKDYFDYSNISKFQTNPYYIKSLDIL